MKGDELVNADELATITEEGVTELGLKWPLAHSIYELKIPRKVYCPNETLPKPITNYEEYIDFLYLNVFPLVDQLEKEANIEYWHVLNHGEYLDLRLLIVGENQMEKVQSVLAQHSIAQKPLTKWGVYGDQNLGSRLGCQALLRLYYAQSKFVRDLVRSIYWLRKKSGHEDIKTLITCMTCSVPIYTSHMLLNIFPAYIIYYEGVAHLVEGESRLRSLLEKGQMRKGAEIILDKIRAANQELRNLLKI